jgi:hypothetical protein
VIRELFIFPLGRMHVVAVDGDPSDAEAREIVERLHEMGTRGPCHFVSVQEMEGWGWIRKERANLHADYRY